MRKLLYILLFFFPYLALAQFPGPNQSFEYAELIAAYEKLAEKSDMASFSVIGNTDIGKPLHALILSKSKDFDPISVRAAGKHVLLINNGIHPGESCGIDASYQLAKSIIENQNNIQQYLDKLVIVIIPIYNVGGMLNRGSFSRANQNGPEEYGFRGNAQNLDLNRDYIKCDSKNAESFTKLFHKWQTNYFIETHTTNGSDHQYTLTLIASQKDKLNPVLSKYQENFLLPSLYANMKSKQKDMIPYVYTLYDEPKKGIKAFYDSPRYSSGYTSLFNCYSFITEAHVFKSYDQRVQHTLAYLETFIKEVDLQFDQLNQTFIEAKHYSEKQTVFPLSWELDSSIKSKLTFSGYTVNYEISPLTGQDIKRYDKSQPYKAEINYFQSYKAKTSVKRPQYYLIPQAYSKVIKRLKWNEIQFHKLKNDSIILVEAYYIEDFSSPEKPYEGHYLHQNIVLSKRKDSIQFYKGDYMVPCNQKNARYLIEVLEPGSDDGFFAWNFFDACLQQKEWFSDYAFEPKAIALLEQDQVLKQHFIEKKNQDTSFANNSFAQLYFIYTRSPYYERSAFRFPVYRINESINGK